MLSAVRFETGAGTARARRKRYPLVVVLSHSRRMLLRVYERRTMETFFRDSEDAFALFGGVPRELVSEQMKTVITKDFLLLGGSWSSTRSSSHSRRTGSFRPRASHVPSEDEGEGETPDPVRLGGEPWSTARSSSTTCTPGADWERWLASHPRAPHATTTKRLTQRSERRCARRCSFR
jgi:hypothetical protein